MGLDSLRAGAAPSSREVASAHGRARYTAQVNSITLEHLSSPLAELHGDATHAALVAKLCAVAAGQRLLELRRDLGPRDWPIWLGGECSIPKAIVGHYMKAADRHKERERVRSGPHRLRVRNPET